MVGVVETICMSSVSRLRGRGKPGEKIRKVIANPIVPLFRLA